MFEGHELPLPAHFDPAKIGEVWKVDYYTRAAEAEAFATEHQIEPASKDRFTICLIAVDVQNTFCIPGYELFVAGRTGTAALDDNHRLCEFIYRNVTSITEICPTMDTHQAIQIFHAIFLINDDGEHPEPFTLISREDILQGKWKFNPALSGQIGVDAEQGQRHLEHYVEKLQAGSRYELTIWPYHAMLGGLGHALVSSVEEAIFFHSIARSSQPNFQVKGNHPLTENYSVLSPEIRTDANGKTIAHKNRQLIEKLKNFDAVVIAGQAKSHCVAWTIDDLSKELKAHDEKLLEKVYLLVDCTSPVVIPDVIDYTDAANAAFHKFAESGMHLVRSTDPIKSWPGIGA
ncbi:MAG: isochorismatase [Deferribacteres bacterium]|nr:isochorismatase [candidate division KSB1 bacterium]MCB9511991.1 isochorismatase [Deferribacteres bacterium]